MVEEKSILNMAESDRGQAKDEEGKLERDRGEGTRKEGEYEGWGEKMPNGTGEEIHQ